MTTERAERGGAKRHREQPMIPDSPGGKIVERHRIALCAAAETPARLVALVLTLFGLAGLVNSGSPGPPALPIAFLGGCRFAAFGLCSPPSSTT